GCESATTGVGAGAAWSTKTATLAVSQTRSFPSSSRPAMTASMTESWTMTRDTGTMTRSPTFASRPDARERIFSASDLGNDPFSQDRIELGHRELARGGHGLHPMRDRPWPGAAGLEAQLAR